MKDLAVVGSWPEFPDIEGFFARVLGKREVGEPVSAWRPAPEAVLSALTQQEKKAYIAALLPLARGGRKHYRNLRRLYQLFAFMEMQAADRLALLDTFERASFSAPSIPCFDNREVRRSLLEEAEKFASNAPSRTAYDYLALLRLQLNVKSRNSRKLMRLFDKLTDIENRAAGLLGKRGHIVRLDDRRLEIFKKSLAAIGVPSAILFPLGTIGLSTEGITTGLVALGGGVILPAGVAMVAGLGVSVAIGITTKKMLDMLLPTVDADRCSIDIQELRHGAVEVERLIDEVGADLPDAPQRERVRARIAEIIQRIAPISKAQRARTESAVEHARVLGERYFAMLRQDRAVIEGSHYSLARELERLAGLDLRAPQAIAFN